MRIKFIILLSLVFIGFSFKTLENNANANAVMIEWTENVKGDFSFKEKWSYPESVYRNKFGQLSCDGLYPTEIDRMKDASGKIYKDSLQAFYKIIDTTHVFHSLKSEAKIYEGSVPDVIEFRKLKNGKIIGNSVNNISGYSSLKIELDNKNCDAWIEFNSYADLGDHLFPLENGKISIDKSLFKEGIIKARFDFKFRNTLEPEKELFWRGQIYSQIESE